MASEARLTTAGGLTRDRGRARRPLRPTAEGHRGGIELIERLAGEWRELCYEPTSPPSVPGPGSCS
jgi:hypothetical protein